MTRTDNFQWYCKDQPHLCLHTSTRGFVLLNIHKNAMVCWFLFILYLCHVFISYMYLVCYENYLLKLFSQVNLLAFGVIIYKVFRHTAGLKPEVSCYENIR